MKIYAIALFAILAAACSGQQQSQDDLEATNEESAQIEDEGNDAQNENNVADEESDNDGESLNNDVANDTQDGDLTAQQAPVQNVPVQEVPSNVPANVPANVPTNPAGGANMAGGGAQPTPSTPPPAAAGNTAPLQGGRVLYVPAGGVQIVNGPNGSPVGDLVQGDHPLTWEENGWIKLADGAFVPAGSLSEKGVPRAFPGATFQ